MLNRRKIFVNRLEVVLHSTDIKEKKVNSFVYLWCKKIFFHIIMPFSENLHEESKRCVLIQPNMCGNYPHRISVTRSAWYMALVVKRYWNMCNAIEKGLLDVQWVTLVFCKFKPPFFNLIFFWLVTQISAVFLVCFLCLVNQREQGFRE